MTLTLLIVLASTHLEDLHLIVATMRHYRCQHLGTLNQRRTKLDGFTSTHCEHLIQGDFGADVCRYLFYFQFFTSRNLILLAAGFYDPYMGTSSLNFQ